MCNIYSFEKLPHLHSNYYLNDFFDVSYTYNLQCKIDFMIYRKSRVEMVRIGT